MMTAFLIVPPRETSHFLISILSNELWRRALADPIPPSGSKLLSLLILFQNNDAQARSLGVIDR